MASADEILAEMGDLRRRLDSQETELRGFKEDGGQANRYGGEGNKGNPPVFAGDREMTFNEWNFKFKSYMCNVSAPLLEGMSTIEHRQDVLETSGYTEEQSQMAAGLYYQLTMYTEGTPLGVVRKVTTHDGFEAYRRLVYQYKDSKGKWAEDEKFEGYCGRCGRWGHRQEDCYERVHSTEIGEAWDEDSQKEGLPERRQPRGV